jgi:prolipoprotein diacylglyceryltransferase
MIYPVSILFGDGTGSIAMLPVMAALSVSYAFGEGMGRLSCISFGCCYGKPLSQSHPLLKRLFRNRHFIFHGSTKKIAYASAMEGQPVLPIQAITSMIYCTVGLSGMFLFLKCRYTAAFLTTIITTQLWRVCSEFLRADYRGERKFSAYQWMGIGLVAYALALAYFFDAAPLRSPGSHGGAACLLDA